MDTFALSDVQLANLKTLMLLREHIKLDRAVACCVWNLEAAQADSIGHMTPEQIVTAVQELGPVSLFYLRQDFTSLLALPPGLGAAIAAVRPPVLRPATPDSLPAAS
jgi:hypothetical protein